MASGSRSMFALLTLLALACGGGGGGDTAPPPPPPTGHSVEVRPVPTPDPPATTTTGGLANLVACARLAGYVRHFHPTAAVDAADWGTLLREGMRKAEGATDAADLAQRLRSAFAEVAPLVQVFPEGTNPPLPPELLTPPAGADRLQWWDILGWSPEPPVHLSYNPFHRVLVRGSAAALPAGTPLPSAPFEASLGAGLRCRIPLSLPADATDALPRAPGQTWRYASLNDADRATRFADVALFWNVIQHHHPYLDLLPAPWLEGLGPALAEAALDGDDPAFARTFAALYAKLQDSHGVLGDPSAPFTASAPLVLTATADGWVIAQVLSGAPAALSPGDLLLKVDGQPIGDLWSDFQAHHPGSPQWLRVLARRWLLAGAAGSSLTLDLQALDGSPKQVTLSRSVTDYWQAAPPLPTPAHGSEVRPGILYLDLSQLNAASFTTLRPKLLTATGVIADRRRYYHASGDDAFSDLLALALKTAIPSGVRIDVPRPLPDQPLAHFDTFSWPGVAPAATPMAGRLVFLQDGQAISYSETLMTWVQASGLPILGEASAGADGNVTYTHLPGGYELNFTGMRCLKIDGSQLQIVGITPTQPVAYTRAALAQGKDDLVEAALTLIQGP